MKKITVALIACLLCATAVFAQKYGHVNRGEIAQVMPGVESINVKLMEFQKSMQIVYENMMNEAQTLKDKLDREAGTMSTSIRKLREDELNALANRIQEFAYNAQEDMEEEQRKLEAPFIEKLQNAINEVAKEHKYIYIFDTAILLYSEGGDDVTPLVKKKLGIK
jgi:outer membrane protein